MQRLQGLDQLHVLVHGVLLGHAFNLLPRVPFSLALEIHHSRTRGVDVSHVGLLEQGVEFEHLLVRRLRTK